MTHRQSPCGDIVPGVGDGGKDVEGGVDQLMSLGECETVCSSSAFEQWDSYWEDLTRYRMTYLSVSYLIYLFFKGEPLQQQQMIKTS